MKMRKVIEVVTKTYSEAQYILNRFPDSYWFVDGDSEDIYKTRFYIPDTHENLSSVTEALSEWKEVNKK